MGVPAVVTAGGRLSGSLATRAGSDVKALATVAGSTLLSGVLDALRASSRVGQIAVVGPKEQLHPHVGDHASLIDEGASGIDNVRRGLAAVRESAGDGLVVLAASDLPFLCADAIDDLIARAPEDADLVFPILRRAHFESRFPDMPGAWTKLADGELTGGSVLLVRPAAIERNADLIERVFEARKNQWSMARLLGLGTALKFATGRLSVADAERRASALTGCRCRVVWDAHPHLACDLDDDADFDYAEAHDRAA